MQLTRTEVEEYEEALVMYYDGGNIELGGAIYCGWFVTLTFPPEGTEWKVAFRWMDHTLRLMGLTVSYIGNQYLC